MLVISSLFSLATLLTGLYAFSMSSTRGSELVTTFFLLLLASAISWLMSPSVLRRYPPLQWPTRNASEM